MGFINQFITRRPHIVPCLWLIVRPYLWLQSLVFSMFFFVDTLSSSLDNVVVLWHILGDVLFFRGIIDVQFHNLQLFT